MTVEAMWLAIDDLDFSRIKAKLLHQKQVDWTSESLEQAESGYRRFLKLAAKYPDTPAVPSEQVDAFWHAHILDTKRYAGDCERIFGYMLHHDPYVGIDGTEDEARLLDMAAASDALGLREFGSPLTSAAYCAREVAHAAAHCARVAKTEKPAYCAREAKAEEPSYCAREANADDSPFRAGSGAVRPAYCAVTSLQSAVC